MHEDQSRISTEAELRSRTEDLRLSRERLALAMQAGQSGTFDWDIEHNVNVWSSEIEELYGVRPGDFGGTFEAWEKLVFPEDLGKAKAAVDESLKTGFLAGDWRVRRASDGQIRWLRARAKVLFDPAGRPMRMLGINVDVTEEMEARAALQATEERLHTVIANAPVVLFATDREGCLTFIEGRPVPTMGLPADRGIGHHITELFGVDRPAFQAAFQEILGGREWRGVLRYRGRVFEARFEAQNGPSGEAVGVLGLLMDITERAQAEDRFTKAFDKSPVPMAISRVADGQFIEANGAYAAAVGFTRQELRGHTSIELRLWVNPDERGRHVQQILSESPTEEFPLTLRRKDGTLRSFMVSGEPITLGDVACILTTIRDVTEWKDLQRRLVESERLASTGQFAGFIAHQLNTPLTNIGLLTHAIEARVEDPVAREKLGKIDVQRRTASSILSDLISFARQRKLHPELVDLRSIVAMACAQVEPFRKPTVSLMREVPAAPVSVRLDAPMIQEALVNLLKNALEATDEGQVVIILHRQDDGVSVTVADTGTGISAAALPHLFEPFFTTKPGSVGTGLGLPLCKAVAEAHGGRIEVTTEVGKGSTFTLRLPLEAPRP